MNDSDLREIVHFQELEIKRLKKTVLALTGRRLITAICKKCGTEFHPKWGTRGVYCNRACMVAANIKIYNCKYCGKTFSKRRMNAGEDPMFCKAKCYNDWRRCQKHVRSIRKDYDGRMRVLPESNGGEVSGVLHKGSGAGVGEEATDRLAGGDASGGTNQDPQTESRAPAGTPFPSRGVGRQEQEDVEQDNGREGSDNESDV